MSVIVLLSSLTLWGIVHSFLASRLAKDLFSFKIGHSDLYRLAYNGFAGISFLPILYLMVILPNHALYSAPPPWDKILFGGQVFAALMLLTAFLQTDSLSFIGVKQLFEKEKNGALVTKGLYRIVRHPLYTFGLMYIWLSPIVTQNSLSVYLGATLYTLIGAHFEERKLLRDFGEAYADYRRNTPMFIPGLIFKK